MKLANKMILFLVAIVCMVQMLVGCNKQQTTSYYDTYITNVANDQTNISQEKDYWAVRTIIEGKQGYGSCEFLGKQITGTYYLTQSIPCTPYTVDRYFTNEGVEFSLRSDTGELKTLNLMSKDFFATEPFLEDVNNPKETVVAIARKVAEKFIDPSNYKQTTRELRTRTVERDGKDYSLTYYEVAFTKNVCGYPTRDHITMEITSKGNIAQIAIGDIGGLDNLSIKIDNSKVQDVIAAKIDKIYTQKSFSVVSLNVAQQTLARTPDGSIGIVSQIEVKIKDGDDTFDTTVEVFTSLLN
ncbi:MAG: hypothetical protein E7468_01905 [Ruminococcaceae bacterium]|nr:hypothetical protein [Oscillospiraceae bacterium]